MPAGDRNGRRMAEHGLLARAAQPSIKPLPHKLMTAKMYCLHTESTYTRRVRDDIAKHVLVGGEEAFVPLTARSKKIHGEWTDVMIPMFPGYVFLRTGDSTGLFERLKGSLGKTIFKYVNLIRDEEYIIPLSKHDEQIVTELSDREHVIRESKGYMTGDKLIVTEGPLKGREGSIISINRHRRTAMLAVDFLGEKRHVTVGLEVVRKE
ncbi:MAG: antiterminator LoaP [bacterium LCO1.1]|uniref:Antiterminator LoaP n=1 Tax=Candidatus Weimeria bifida TaxID=2599074 RepID=A0A6N7J0N6_9FIRM|nr:antiterminator LoaP [Candidatus Weimeria bifida]